jgi:S1-C subfamily serine protease
VNVLDVFLAIAMVSALIGGWRVGLVARVASWIGAAGGFLLALKLLPVVLRKFGEIAPTGRLFLTLGVLLVGAAIGGALGEAIGSALRRAVPPPARILDRTGGAFVGVVGLVIGLWLFLPIAAQVPGAAAQQARNSRILAAIDDVAPEPPDASRAVRSLVGDARFPDVFADLRPAPDIGPPPSEIPVAAAVVARAVQSTVNVEADGCGGRHEGSGFAAAENLIATNAHVVAGAERIRVRKPDGRLLAATIVLFDPARDLALLSVPRLGQAALPIESAEEGTPGAVLGYPGGQDTVRVAPAVIRREAPTRGRDIYNRRETTRQVLYLASELRPGDSGSALIDGEGRVIGVAFAIAPDRPGTAFALDDSELLTALAAPRTPGAGGPCI